MYLLIKPTDALNSNFIGITTLHISGSLSAHHQEFLAVHWLWYILCRFDDRLQPGAPVSKRSSQLHKMYNSRCTANISWWWAERLPETRRVVIPIKLEFGASVGFIHKECVTMHGHTIFLKKINYSVYDMFRTSKCSSSGRLVHAVLWYFFMHPYKQSGRCLTNCMYKSSWGWTIGCSKHVE